MSFDYSLMEFAQPVLRFCPIFASCLISDNIPRISLCVVSFMLVEDAGVGLVAELELRTESRRSLDVAWHPTLYY